MSDTPFQRGCKSMDAARVEILVPIISKILDRINTTYHAQKWLGAHGDMRCKHCSDRGLDCVSQRSRVACRRCLHSKKSYSCSRLVLAIKETIPKYRSGYFSDVLITRALREAESRRRKVRSRSVDTGCLSDASSVAASTTIAEEDTEDDSYPIPSKFEVSFNLGIDSTIEDYANAYNVAQKSLRNEEWRSQDLLYVLREHEAELLAQTRKSRELEAVVLDMTDERKSLVEDNNNLYDECKRLRRENQDLVEKNTHYRLEHQALSENLAIVKELNQLYKLQLGQGRANALVLSKPRRSDGDATVLKEKLRSAEYTIGQLTRINEHFRREEQLRRRRVFNDLVHLDSLYGNLDRKLRNTEESFMDKGDAQRHLTDLATWVTLFTMSEGFNCEESTEHLRISA